MSMWRRLTDFRQSLSRCVVVGGWPSWQRWVVCLLGVAGTLPILLALAFAVAVVRHSASTWLGVPLVAGAMLIYWAPAAVWDSWPTTVPTVLVAATGIALLTHRYRCAAQRDPDQPGSPRYRRFGRRCLQAACVYGVWAVGVGIVMLLSFAAL